MPRLTLDELRRKRAEVQKSLYLREGEFRGKIIVHMGTCGIAAGARAIVSTFLEELEKSGVRDIMVTTSGCAGLCSKEPMATVEMLNSPPVRYIELTPDKARKIFQEHVVGGKALAEYALGIGFERGG
ncbi:MAG: (2Fe-2S) ferredoxin domain-containing protein [Blastocatellia bacterium]|nr:(2Fe-2S) ferredoxin domain-containing protein [Blastocatellia bacterium]MDW8168580.1 (2Fe-2S) ferredoxin domain-containing protein [Acidobacteriota bacterium]